MVRQKGFAVLSHPVYDTLSWQPRDINVTVRQKCSFLTRMRTSGAPVRVFLPWFCLLNFIRMAGHGARRQSFQASKRISTCGQAKDPHLGCCSLRLLERGPVPSSNRPGGLLGTPGNHAMHSGWPDCFFPRPKPFSSLCSQWVDLREIFVFLGFLITQGTVNNS